MSRKTQIYVCWIILALPALFIFAQYRSGEIGYGTALSLSGDIAVKLLIVTLAITPLRKLRPQIGQFWFKFRRAFGVAVFMYSCLHLAIYAAKKADASKILMEGIQPDLLTGWIALAIFSVLALTSNDLWVRRLGQTWKRLHRWSYLSAGLVIAHWVLTAFDPFSAYIHGIVLAGLLLLRGYKRTK